MNGLLLLDKPIFYTSHDIVDVVRRKLQIRRVGHAGTLDPMATGLLVIMIGQATSLFAKLSGHDKEYEGLLTLGIETDTHDLEGKIVKTHDASATSPELIERAFRNLLGEQTQEIPRYSSAKVGGRKSYAMARKNVAFETQTKQVDIKALEIQAIDMPNVYFRADVSKGTYIRALCAQIGRDLGTVACLSALRRTRSGQFRLSDGLTIEQLRAMPVAQIQSRLIQMEPETAVR